jgi:diguanylate cyclase (GGDEF)-like protein
MDHRFITLSSSAALFAGLCFLLILRPEQGPVTFPFFGLIFLWMDVRRDAEIPIIFTFLVTVVGMALVTRAPAPAEKAALLLETAGLWILDFGIGAHRSLSLKDQSRMSAERAVLEASIRDDERDLDYYRAYKQTVDGQIRLRRDLTESAKSLGSTLNSAEVHSRLVEILSARFPGARVTVLAGAPDDPLVESAAKRGGAVLVKDVSLDERFVKLRGRCRSGMAIPIKVMRQPAGFLKLESDQPGAFGPEDVRTADLFATMASLSLENIQFYEQVHEQATHDQLTQLYSHKAFQARLHDELLRSGRSQTPLSFILGDIDHFKSYNDRYGHQAGDQLLRTVAAILSSFARPVDFAARYGGEEFCLIVPNFVRSEAVDLANRIRLRIEAEPFVFHGENTRAAMSFGVSSFPQDATTASQIIRVADERLYRAKENGRNQVVG